MILTTILLFITDALARLPLMGVLAMVITNFLYIVFKDIIKYLKKDRITNLLSNITERLEEQSAINEKVLDYLRTVSSKYTTEVTFQQVYIIIKDILYVGKNKIYIYSKSLIQSYSVNKKNKTKEKLIKYITGIYNSNINKLDEFKYSSKKLSEFLNPEVIEIISTSIIEIYESDLNNKQKEQEIGETLNQLFSEFGNKMFKNIKTYQSENDIL